MGRTPRTRRGTLGRLLSVTAAASAGCQAPPNNPSFDVSIAEARQAIERMKDQPQTLDRPVVVLGGYLDVGLAARHVVRRLEATTQGQPIVAVSFPFEMSFDGCRRRVLDAVSKAFADQPDPFEVEVDVIGVSMGGLVGRYVAMEQPGEPRLRVRRLFTIATPHRGAALAKLPSWHGLVKAMRRDSAFLESLDAEAAEAPYELIPYVRLDDVIVGSANAAPPGQQPRWVDNPSLTAAHLHAHRDPRILADILLRLRGQTPFSTDPPAPLPVAAAGQPSSHTPEPHPADPSI